MQRAMTMATLLKRSDASLYRVFLGADCATFVQRLTHEHCFEIHAMLHAPSVTTDAHKKLGAAIACLGTDRGNAWFEASLEQAAMVFLTVLPSESLFAGAAPSLETAALGEYVGDAPEMPQVTPVVPAASADVASDDEAADPLWAYVQACSTREATKCTDIRTALEEKVGKAAAQELLARTKPTVAQDSSGKKNRVLKLGGSLLKLK